MPPSFTTWCLYCQLDTQAGFMVQRVCVCVCMCVCMCVCVCGALAITTALSLAA